MIQASLDWLAQKAEDYYPQPFHWLFYPLLALLFVWAVIGLVFFTFG